MKTKALALSACLALFCSCSTAPNWSPNDSIRPPLPAETPFNNGAGHGENLFLRLHLENGQELLFGVDTGSAVTVLDKSFEPVLGKRLGTRKTTYGFYGKATLNAYSTPKLYLGNTLLLTGDQIFTDDLRPMAHGQPLMGILGMDCLRYYCIQLDFAADKISFLDPDHLKNENLGKAFPLTIDLGNASMHASFFGQKDVYFMIDTGASMDAVLKPKLFQRVLREHVADSTKQIKLSADMPELQVAFFSTIVFDDEAYKNFVLSDSPDENILGLRFLARHLATLNFPKQVMYLSPTPQNFNNESGKRFELK